MTLADNSLTLHVSYHSVILLDSVMASLGSPAFRLVDQACTFLHAETKIDFFTPQYCFCCLIRIMGASYPALVRCSYR